MRKNWLLLILATLLVTSQNNAIAQAQAQKAKFRNKANDPVAKLPYYKKLRWADNLFSAGSYFNAIDYYQQLKQEQERNPYLTYQLAECYWYSRDYVNASHYYAEAYSLAPKLYPEAIFKEAMMLKMQGEYETAIITFRKFMSDNPKTYKKLKKFAQIQIDGCTMGMNSVKDPQPVNVINAGPNVNSAYTELSPYPLGDTALLFSTMRQNSVVEIDKRKRDEYMSRFMVSRKQEHVAQVDSFQWPIRFMDGRFNKSNVHVGNGSFSPGGERFYFTRCSEEDSLKVTCKIFVSHFDVEKWSEPEEVEGGINDDGSNTQPFVANVGKKEVLFFSSNRKLQSRGGYDIWYSIIDPRNGSYRRPQNAGKQVNTEHDEITPYYDSRVNTLYFSSNGWVTMGGFDVFSAVGGPSRYHNLKNMGYPINTSADELYFIKDPLGKPDAYLVSNRIGSIALKNPTCCDDIWRVQFEPRLVVIGKVINRKSQQLVNEVVVKMIDQQGDMKTFNSSDGNFAFSMSRAKAYVLTGDKQGFSSTRASVSTMDVKRSDPDDTVTVTLYMDSIVHSFEVSNVYYDFDKAILRPESVASLDSVVNFMKDNPSLSVEIYSFTDSKGTDKYNAALSIRRAEAVLNYLEKSGVDKNRMVAKGFGDKMPAAPNTVGNKDNPEGRQLNRRTEFRIVSDVPTRRIIYNSAKPGTMDQQDKNLKINENMNDEPTENDAESEKGKPGSRVNKK
ncbi:MAG: OmpA family protein [Taibaiella sp.]|nr:OmpA family protein [Taibaiella sp.]